MGLELYAAYATVHAHFHAHPALINIVLHVDNMAACFALVKGRTRNLRSGKIAAAHHTLLDRARARVDVACINADRNTADACCRFASFHDLCVQHGPFAQLHIDHLDLLSTFAHPSPSRSPIALDCDSDTNSKTPRAV